YAGETLQIPSCGSFLGGAGFDQGLEQAWSESNYHGVMNIMRHLGMLPGPVQKAERYLIYKARQYINPSKGGLLVPVRPTDEFGRPVAKGEVLGHVVSPFSLERIEELSSPFDGFLGYWARDYPVNPGDWA